jgi:hypothetical protein
MAYGLLDILDLTEAQARALRDQLAALDVFHGLHFYQRDDDSGALIVTSDGWPGEVRIHLDGSVEEVE